MELRMSAPLQLRVERTLQGMGLALDNGATLVQQVGGFSPHGDFESDSCRSLPGCTIYRGRDMLKKNVL